MEAQTLILRAGKYRAEVSKRTNLTRYANMPYQVKQVEETPKAKFLKEKVKNIFVYKTFEEAQQRAEAYINNIQANINSRQAEIEKKRNENANVIASNFYKIGDFVVNSWGYEQTNVEFYKVIEVGNKTIKIQEVCQEEVEGSAGYDCCNVIPTDEFTVREVIYTLRVKAMGHLSNPQSYYHFHKWSGRPQYKSWYN